jgi:hypothetical protein
MEASNAVPHCPWPICLLTIFVVPNVPGHICDRNNYNHRQKQQQMHGRKFTDHLFEHRKDILIPFCRRQSRYDYLYSLSIAFLINMA